MQHLARRNGGRMQRLPFAQHAIDSVGFGSRRPPPRCRPALRPGDGAADGGRVRSVTENQLAENQQLRKHPRRGHVSFACLRPSRRLHPSTHRTPGGGETASSSRPPSRRPPCRHSHHRRQCLRPTVPTKAAERRLEGNTLNQVAGDRQRAGDSAANAEKPFQIRRQNPQRAIPRFRQRDETSTATRGEGYSPRGHGNVRTARPRHRHLQASQHVAQHRESTPERPSSHVLRTCASLRLQVLSASSTTRPSRIEGNFMELSTASRGASRGARRRQPAVERRRRFRVRWRFRRAVNDLEGDRGEQPRRISSWWVAL
eukprot:ctg_2725.g457